MDFEENKKMFNVVTYWPMAFNKMAASMPTNGIWAYMEMVPKSNFAHRARSSQVMYYNL